MRYLLIACLALFPLMNGCATFGEAQNDMEQAERIASAVYDGLVILEAIAETQGATPEQLAILQRVRELVQQYEAGFRTINELNAEAMPLLEKAITQDMITEHTPHVAPGPVRQ